MTDIDKLIVKGKPQAPSKFIIMGDPMTGKTTLAAKAPKPLFISTDGNAAKAGLDAIAATDLNIVREVCLEYFPKSDYETLVIDTIEGIADLFEKTVIDAWNQETGAAVTALTDVAYGKLTGQFNRRIAAFAETLWSLPKNVIVLTYTKRQVDDIGGGIVLNSELRQINKFTKFADGFIMTSYDGEKYKAGVVHKRTVMAGEVDYGDIMPFLRAAGWEFPKNVKTKVGTAKRS
jgi:hypothetical protein